MKIQLRHMISIPWIGGSILEEYNIANGADDESIKRYVFTNLGVTEWQFRAWLDAEGRIRCNALKANGKRCRCYVSGVKIESPREWVDADKIGGYCKIHGGD